MPTPTLEPGKPAPPFSLQDQDDKPVTLDQFRGKWLALYFYPKDDTPGCTTEACEFTDDIEQFQSLNAVVLGVSPDSPASHREFIQKHNLKIALLSDPDHKVMETYGAWGEKTSYGKTTIGVIRSTVLIDPQGRIAHHWPKVTAQRGPRAGHADQVRTTLQQLQT